MMGRSTRVIGLGLLLVVGLATATALATPVIDSAVVKLRIWNDDPASTITETNLYPSVVSIQDVHSGTGGWTNRHAFRLSDNGGISETPFNNGDGFAFFSDVKIEGNTVAEGGLNFTPWWSKDVDGAFMLNTESGEIACFGGRLPFYSFTGNYGLHYTAGETVRQGIVYSPNGLSEASPATIQYCLIKGGTWYTSGPLAFDMGNPGEDPPYGLWGNLNDGRLGGYFMAKTGNPAPAGNWQKITFGNMTFVPEPATLALLGIAAAFALRRGR
jgi:hypothetical protein